MASRFGYGKRGEPIPGSHMLREFCGHCGEAVRVYPAALEKRNYCLECDGHEREGRLDHTPLGRRVGFGHTSN